MKFRGKNIMSMLATILSFFLLSGVYAARPPTQFERKNVVLESEVLNSSSRVLQQTAAGSEVAEEDEARECQDAKLGVNLEIKIGEILRALKTSSIALCYDECQSMESCTTYRRNRSSGSCELISAKRAEFETNPESDFDVGGSVQHAVGVKRTDATGVQPNYECTITEGNTYPNGNILVRGRSRTVEHCCQTCRACKRCNSWYHNNRNKRCILNRNIPSKVEADYSRFSGGTV